MLLNSIPLTTNALLKKAKTGTRWIIQTDRDLEREEHRKLKKVYAPLF